MTLKDFFSVFVFGGHFVRRSRNMCAIFREYHGDHSCDVHYFKFGPVFQEMSFKEKKYERRT